MLHPDDWPNNDADTSFTDDLPAWLAFPVLVLGCLLSSRRVRWVLVIALGAGALLLCSCVRPALISISPFTPTPSSQQGALGAQHDQAQSRKVTADTGSIPVPATNPGYQPRPGPVPSADDQLQDFLDRATGRRVER